MKRKELYRRCLAAVLGTAVAAGAFASPVRAAGLQAAPAAETAPGTPLMLTELVPDTDNENGADAYEYFEITNVSDRAVSLDQYQIIYNVTDLWEPDQDGIVIEPGQSLLLWIINDGNRELTADDFNRYYTEKTGAEQSFEIGKDLATVHSDGMHNSKERQMSICTNTGIELNRVRYNDGDIKEVKANKGITFAYNPADVEMVRIAYDSALTPGSMTEEQKPEGVYAFAQSSIDPELSFAEVQHKGEAWTLEIIPNSANTVTDAKIYLKPDKAEEYAVYDLKYSGDKLVFELPYDQTGDWTGFTFYAELTDGISVAATQESAVAIERTDVDKSSLPAVLITEIMPDSSNVDGSDGYEFIELYNNSDQRINLKDYKIYYNYPDQGNASDVLWGSIDDDIWVESKAAAVFWIKNGPNDSYTAEQFNEKFGTSLVMGENLFEIHSGGMANGSPRALRVTTSVGDEVDFVSYNMETGVDDTYADKSIKYMFSSSTMTSAIADNQADPDPGAVKEEDRPEGAELTVPQTAPSVTDQTPAQFENENGLAFRVNAVADGTSIKTVKLAFKDNTSEEYEIYNLTRGTEEDTFEKVIAAIDLTGKKSYEYYFEVSDGFQTVRTETGTTVSVSGEQEEIRLNVADGDILAGQQDLIVTGESVTLDGTALEGGVPSVEKSAKIVFDVSQTDVFFKNAVAIGDHVLGIFDDGTYENWATVSYDVDPSWFTKGETIQIDIHAGNKANALEHNEENNDDFVVKNIRLIMPDGTTLRADGYEDPEEVINMGDSSGKTEILKAVFTPREETFGSIRFTIDTAAYADGSHTLTVLKGQDEKTVSFRIDNTAPEITTNMMEQEYHGTFTIEAEASDAVAGLQSLTAQLDGGYIELPYEARSLEMEAGGHELVLTARDTKGNTSTKTVVFTTPAEDAEIGMDITPEPGSTVEEDPVFSVRVTDPTSDTMDVAFKYGERYVLGDSNIAVSSGISSQAGSNQNVFDGTDANGFPYEQFDITVGENVSENASIEVKWEGQTNSAKTKMYVYNTVTGVWEETAAERSEEEGAAELAALIPLKDHLSGQKVQVMVQAGEGYTPTQYAPGTPALTPVYETTPTSNESDQDRGTYDFTFAIESDTQYYNEDTPDNPEAIGKYESQLAIHDWLISNRGRMNIQYLFHNGDLIDDEPMASQWENADAAYRMLDEAGFPYGVLAGNHDVGHKTEDYNNFSKYFGEWRYASDPWYEGSYKDNKGHYDLISVGGIDFIMVYMGWGIGDEEIRWMNDVLAQYPERKAILNFHEYLLASGGLGEEPQRVYNEVVSVNPNVCMVFSGHYHNAQTVVKEFDDNKDGVNDRKVYEMLFDYQGLTEGGMGYIRLMHFDIEGQQIHFRTYSPELNDYNAKDTVAGADTSIAGEEDFTVSFADLGIVPAKKTLEVSSLDVNVYGDELIGAAEGVDSGERAEYTMKDAQDGTFGWYAEVTDEYGGLSRTNVNYVTVKKDRTAPVITLPEKTEIHVGDVFDPMEGVTAVDGKDGDLTGAVQVMGSVDTSREGTYTLTYQVSDKAGNTAVAERTVVVLAEETPGTDAAVIEMIQNAPEGGRVPITAEGENPVISSEILAAASGKDVDLVITTTEGAVITLNGKEITDVSDFGVKLEIYTVDRKICVAFVNAVKLPGKLTVAFEEENVFGLTQTGVKTELTAETAKGSASAAAVLLENGRVSVEYTTADAVKAELSWQKNTGADPDKNTGTPDKGSDSSDRKNAPRTGESAPLGTGAGVLAVSAAAGAALIILKRKKNVIW